MSFAINQGLFKLKIIDHHAILGVSIDADPKQIRLKYLKIAQKLHPDKCRLDESKVKMAGQILSKLVNPAYEQLSRKADFAEHQLVLTQVGKRLAENKAKINVKSELAEELLQAGNGAELIYPQLLKKLTVDHYQSLEQITKDIGRISELNLVYLMLKCDRAAEFVPQSKIKQSLNSSAKAKPNQDKQTIPQSKSTVTQAQDLSSQTTAKTEEPTPESRVDAFVDRAQQYISRGEFDRAVTELRDALRIDPNHGVAHAVIGKTYLHKRQLTMAKVHIDKACKADPHNATVIESKKALDKLGKVASKSKTSQPGSAQKSNDKQGNSGFFSGFFGSKKK